MWKATIISIAIATQADAQTCGPRDQLVEQLTKKYKETSKGVGLSSATQVVEFWASKKTGTFTVLVTYPNGTTCILATGKSWTVIKAKGEGL